ncbi:Fe/S-dependent 2-methylisocitrate dehydratase AcnD [Aliarcobacter butzleri]|uniref:Aconitate hydratase n=1 Tax=Aliarcobacter butzleri TaxID=28197 RepID=A0AAP4UZ57_9BACT|nr:Fe/S-dependent 2-methylisocitrate dehydratase AcnD [Aliarcobacter butzleri]MDN5052661.1 Fe/S-dependent 2-methylisocitrate dehydratase AcnD [Aliarcobacter butzleri]MDN5074128.1 Fe/S-dependent 2-methylisocitrate dehydratase AcnD [Aliarcobacter butzleri]MDN5116968.1 Fe/S-dependent 2-methylisocitrate dehydratase AcnD [Aliarcobacter butzleri]MDN5132979.1 Fe/S-dependent 2-methylisocitrate dehydratase AcnD [Aliarcobacter butzleri]NUW25553.1 Fe/S-dependent 2-methylisocitrate dehydratase AcnD [Aliar
MTNEKYLKQLDGLDVKYYDVKSAVEDIKAGSFAKLNYTSRVLAENLLRKCPSADLKDSLIQLIEKRTDKDFPWYPSRVICHDILGLTAFVDLAGLREAVAKEGGDPQKVNPVVPTQLIVDHSLAVECGGYDPDAFQKNRDIEDRRNADRFHFINWAKEAFNNVDVIPPGNGIMHQINLEKMSPVVHNIDGIASPDTLVGTDSHTPHVDALGVIAVGVGGLEAENVMLGNPSYMRVPEIIGVEITGTRAAGITATDIALSLTSFLRENNVISAYLEFYGSGIKYLDLGDRATISNMTPEYGASAAMFAIDNRTIDYLKITGREAKQVELVEKYAKANGLWADSLNEATYARTLKFDLSTVTRSLAGPSKPHKLVPTSTLEAEGITKKIEITNDVIPDGAVLIAAITSCTNTSNPRNVVAAGLLAKKANELGLTRKRWVKSSLAPGSKVAELYLKESGLLPELEKLGFGIVGFACTTCNGMSGALDPKLQKEAADSGVYTTAVLSGNRNFDGRIHPFIKEAFLASPPLVIAYAIAGSIRFNIETDVLGKDKNGNDIKLKDIWPSDEEIDAVVNSAVKPEMFGKIYDPMFARNSLGAKKAEPFYKWNTKSTYINKPPYWEDEYMQMPALKNMRPLGVFPDNITTDHLSPSNAILPTSASGEYCIKMGLPIEDLNSYATHRGDHHTASRATLANPKLFNEMVKDENGNVKQGSLTKIMPEGKESRMWEAIETYTQRKQPLIIIAGTNYGQGSSRDWAAKGVRLAGVEVLIAESIERIHRTNLVGMGVLPLQFKEGETRHTYAIDGTEVFEIVGDITPRCDLTVVMTRANGEVVKFSVLCRLDTSAEVEVYKNGGILQKFAKDVIASK